MSLANGNAIRLPRSTSIRPPYQKVSFSIFMSFLWWNDYRLPAHKSSNFHTKEPRRRNCRGSYNTSLITYTIRYQTLGGSFGAHNLGGMQAVLRGFLICNFLRQKRNHPPKMIQQLEVGGVAFSLSFEIGGWTYLIHHKAKDAISLMVTSQFPLQDIARRWPRFFWVTFIFEKTTCGSTGAVKGLGQCWYIMIYIYSPYSNC